MEEKKKKKEKELFLEEDKIGEQALDNAYVNLYFSHEEVKKYEDMRTLFSQDYEAWKEAKRKGLDVKNSFRVMRLGNEGEDPHYHIFSTEGNEKGVQEELNTIHSSRFIVDNKSVESYKWKEKDKGVWERKIEEIVERKMRESDKSKKRLE